MEIFLSTVLWTIVGILVSVVLIRLFIWVIKGEIEDLQNLVKSYKDLSDAVEKWEEYHKQKNCEFKNDLMECEDMVEKIRKLQAMLDELKEDDKS